LLVVVVAVVAAIAVGSVAVAVGVVVVVGVLVLPAGVLDDVLELQAASSSARISKMDDTIKALLVKK
jgi:hypothetical protein